MMRRPFPTLLTGLALTLGAPASVAAQANTPHDADLIEKLYRGQFDTIARTRDALVEVFIVQGALTDGRCQFDYRAADAAAETEGRQVFAFVRELSGNDPGFMIMVGATRSAHPLYLRTGAWIDAAGGCNTPRTQKLQRNVIKVLAARSKGDGWGLRQAAVEDQRRRAEEQQRTKERLAPAGIATNEEIAEWRKQCEGTQGLPGDSRDVRARWCNCVAGWLRPYPAEERAAILRDYRRTIEEIRTKRAWTAEGIDRCTVPESQRRN